MFYRLLIFANFPDLPTPGWLASIKHLIELNAITINPGSDNEEISCYQLHCCHHDELPGSPCEQIDEWYSPISPG